MTKVTGPSGADFQTNDVAVPSGPPTPTEVAPTDEGWLSKAWSTGTDIVMDRTGADTFLDAISAGKEIAEAGVKSTAGAIETSFNFLAEGKFNDYTLNPGPAIERCVAGANETLKKHGGDDPLQLTAHPKMEDVLYTFEVLSGAAGKLDQLPMAAAALAVGVLHENRAITQAVTESAVYQAVKANAGTMLQASTAINAMTLMSVPSGVAVKATEVFKSGLDGAFSGMDASLELIRDRPVLAREQAIAMTIPLRDRLERMPVGDSCEKKFKLKGEVHEGIGAKLGAEISGDVKKLGDNKYEVTLTGKADLFVGLGLSAQSKGVSGDLLAKHKIEIKIEVEGKDAAKVIDAGGDLTSLFTLTNPVGALNAVVKAGQIDPDDVKMKMTSCDIKFERGAEINSGPLKQQLTAELAASTGLGVQASFELEVKHELPVHVSGLTATQERSLQDCLKAMVEPSNSKSLKAEGKIRFDGEMSAEFKLEIESDANRIEAEIKVDIKDPAKVAAHLSISQDELKDISPQLLFDKLGSLPADAVEVSVSLTGHEGYLGAKLAIPPAEYSMGNSHPTQYLRVPDPNFPERDMSANIAEARRQIVALSEGWNNERAVALKA